MNLCDKFCIPERAFEPPDECKPIFGINQSFLRQSDQEETSLDVEDPDDDFNNFDEMIASFEDNEMSDDEKRYRIRVFKKNAESGTETIIINYLTDEILLFKNKELFSHRDYTNREILYEYRDDYCALFKQLNLEDDCRPIKLMYPDLPHMEIASNRIEIRNEIDALMIKLNNMFEKARDIENVDDIDKLTNSYFSDGDRACTKNLLKTINSFLHIIFEKLQAKNEKISEDIKYTHDYLSEFLSNAVSEILHMDEEASSLIKSTIHEDSLKEEYFNRALAAEAMLRSSNEKISSLEKKNK